MSYPQIIPIRDSADEIRLTDYMAHSSGDNLARIRPDGSEAWRVFPPTATKDCWVAAALEAAGLRAQTFGGWSILLDPETGTAIERAFTK